MAYLFPVPGGPIFPVPVIDALHLHEAQSSSQLAKYPAQTDYIPPYVPGGLIPSLNWPDFNPPDTRRPPSEQDPPTNGNNSPPPSIIYNQNNYYLIMPDGTRCRIRTFCD